MRYDEPLLSGTLERRYKRFLADVRLDDGELVTAHTPNTGSMKGCSTPGSRVWLSRSDNPKRKLKFTWELSSEGDVRIGVHTGRTNRLAEEAIEAGAIPSLTGFSRIRREVRFGERSRVDLLVEWDEPEPRRCWVEVKNVTLVDDGAALFPDAVTVRGRKHLVELQRQVEAGDRAAMVYVVQRMDADRVGPADHIDPAYGEELRAALAGGVEAYGLRFDPSPEGIELDQLLPVVERRPSGRP